MKLDLPASMSMHPVFNVSLLKKYLGDRLPLKAGQVEDDVEYKIDSILCHWGHWHYKKYLFDGRGMV